MQQLTAYRRRSITDRRGNTIHEWYSSRPKDDHLADCYNMAVCKERLGDLEGALASAREAHMIYSKLGAWHTEDVQDAATMMQRLEGRV